MAGTLIIALSLISQLVGSGSTGYTFVKLGIGVRPVAMGGAFSALSDDGNAVFWNPSGLGIISSYFVSGMAMNHLTFWDYYNLTSAIPIGKKSGALGIGISYLTAEDDFYSERGEQGEPFRNSDMLLNIGYGRAIGRKQAIAIGGALSIVRSQLYKYSAFGALLDVGFIIHPYKYLYLGTVLKNIGTPRRFIDMWEYPPVNFRQGIAVKIPFGESHTALSFDYSVYPDVRTTFSLGAEVRLRSISLMETLGQDRISGFALMGGYHYSSSEMVPVGYSIGAWSGFSLGASIELWMVKGFYLDIAALLLSYGYLGSSERIALGLNYVPTQGKTKK
jgi:hypothetical protein